MKKYMLCFLLLIVLLVNISAESNKWEYMVLTFGKVSFTDIEFLKQVNKFKTNESDVLTMKALSILDPFLDFSEANSIEQSLDSLGKEGWELVTIVGAIGGDQEFVFKRPYDDSLRLKTLNASVETFNIYLKNEEENPIIQEEEKTELIELDSYEKNLASEKEIEELYDMIQSMIDSQTEYSVIDFEYKKSDSEYLPDSVILFVDGTNSLLIDKYKYRASEVEMYAETARNYIKEIVKGDFILHVAAYIIYDEIYEYVGSAYGYDELR